MDYGGLLGMGGLAGASSEAAAAAAAAASAGPGGLFSSSSSPSFLEAELGGNGSGGGCERGPLASIFQKHDRPAEPEEYDWRSLKMARSEALVTAAPAKGAPFLVRSGSHHSLFPDGEQMLSFSSASRQSDEVVAPDGTLRYYNHPSAASSPQSYLRNAGLYSGSQNASMQGVLSRVRGPFTPSQWLELEHQALIYKYLDANVPIPTTLLIPIRRSLGSSAFPPLSAGSFGPVGWGPFHLGYSGTADPEPGRCRRTDGKKWRCSRDAVADQKYCERHMNRGRHRSRKHVEGQSGHAAKAPNVTSSQPAPAAPAGASPSTLSIAQQQSKSSQSNINDPQPGPFNRMLMSKEDQKECVQNQKNLSVPSPANQKPDNGVFPMSKQHNPFEGTSSGANFGLISTDSLLNPPRSSFSDNISFIPTPKLNDQQTQSNPLRHFIDDWPKPQCDHSTVAWPEVEETQSNRTQLSISVPMHYSEFSSSNHDKPALSPLKLSKEYGPVHMGLHVGALDEVCQRQANWRPISWEASMAGPLGEVLTSTNSTSKDQSKNYSSSSLNLMVDSWDSSPRLESSPSGVLPKTSFGSLSSSTGSSPRAENRKIHESTSSLCNDLLGSSTLVNAPTISSL